MRPFTNPKRPFTCNVCGKIFYSRNDQKTKVENICCSVACSNIFKKKKGPICRDMPLYATWIGIKQRCYNPKCKGYKNYGGRGIDMWKHWRTDFPKFNEWAISNGYEKGLTLDRIDNEKGYYPENCRFATWTVQAFNKRSTHWVIIKGVEKPLKEWAQILGLSENQMYNKIHREGLVSNSSRRSNNDAYRDNPFGIITKGTKEKPFIKKRHGFTPNHELKLNAMPQATIDYLPEIPSPEQAASYAGLRDCWLIHLPGIIVYSKEKQRAIDKAKKIATVLRKNRNLD
jgi:hypothetical protein